VCVRILAKPAVSAASALRRVDEAIPPKTRLRVDFTTTTRLDSEARRRCRPRLLLQRARARVLDGGTMTQGFIAQASFADSHETGAALGAQITDAFGGAPPDALIVFIPPKYDYATVLRSLETACHPKVMLGGSSVGGFASTGYLNEAVACAVALRSSTMLFAAAVGRGLMADRGRAAKELVRTFRGMSDRSHAFRSAIVLIDARTAFADDFIADLTLSTAGTYQLFGGGVAEDTRAQNAYVFHGTEVFSDAVVALEILSNQPLGVGVCQGGWVAASEAMRVTEADGRRLVSLNATPVMEIFHEHAEATAQTLDDNQPLPFFLRNILGIQMGDRYKLRVPLFALPDGAVGCATEIPVEATVHIMKTNGSLASEAAVRAVKAARRSIGAEPPALALFFDCLASSVRHKMGFGFDPRSLQDSLGTTNYVGFGTCGQIVRADGQPTGVQNCTAVACVIPA
jgi:hypothetical protein